MLRYYSFGKDFNNKVQKYLIKRTSKTVILYVASIERAKEIFSIADLCAAEVNNNDNNYNNNNNNNNRKMI